MPTNAEISTLLGELGVATLGECGARPMRTRVKPVWAGATLAAPAYPVRCTPGDNLAIHVAVARAPEGSALVVDVGSNASSATGARCSPPAPRRGASPDW